MRVIANRQQIAKKKKAEQDLIEQKAREKAK